MVFVGFVVCVVGCGGVWRGLLDVLLFFSFFFCLFVCVDLHFNLVKR